MPSPPPPDEPTAHFTAARYLRWLAFAALGFCSVIASVNFWIDPLQFYRKSAVPIAWVEQPYYQNPALARSFPYDAAIIGTSISLSFDSEQVRQRLGWHSLDLALEGAYAHQQSLMCAAALRTGKPKQILWDLMYEYFTGDPDEVSDYDGPFPAYLYDDNRWNELYDYLLNIDTTKASVRALLQRITGRFPHPKSLDELTSIRFTHEPGEKWVRKQWNESHDPKRPWRLHTHPERTTLAKTTASFDANCLEIVKAHPDVTFDFWFPPASFVRHSLMRELAPEAWANYFAWKRHVLTSLSHFPNARLHDFEGAEQIASDLSHYYDPVHFDGYVRAFILDGIVSGKDLATPETLARTEATLKARSVAPWEGGTR